LGEKGQYNEAIDECNKAIELDPDYTWSYHLRAYAYIAKGEFDLAIADCSKAIDLEPWEAHFYLERAHAYIDKGQYALAIADFEECISLTDNPELIEKAQQQIEELSQ